MRRILLLTLLITALLIAAHPPVTAAGPSTLEAKAWLLMDAASGRVLIEHEGDRPLPVASTTKIMTAILAIERGELTDMVTAGQRPYETGGSTIYLEIGEQQRLEDLLYALMLESANDAAVAIAEHLAGSEERFAQWMNEKARSLGASNTNFVNSHGLHHPDHYSTAHDLALIARHAMQNPIFRQIVTTEEREIPGAPGNSPRRLINRNQLLGYYPGANGVKNGYTEEAELTNVASARRGETELIAVVLGASQRLWTSSMALLDFGFSRYETRWATHDGLLLDPVSLRGIGSIQPQVAADLRLTVERGSAPLASRVEWLPDLALPIAAGAPVGWLRIMQEGRELGRVQLTAARPVPAEPLSNSRPPAATAEPGEMLLWVILWLGGSLLMTLRLNSLRDDLPDGTKEEIEGGTEQADRSA